MSDKFRQTLIAFIWPGPIAGPLPLNLFRILAILLVVLFGPIIATFVMAIVTLIFLVWYFSLLELTGGKETLNALLSKLPFGLRQDVETKGPLVLFVSSLFLGVFPYAVFLKLLKYPKDASEILLGLASVANSVLWTGFFWGIIVGAAKLAVGFAF